MKERGKVWEESLILLPKHIQLILLSATIHKPEDFAKWIQTITTKQINLITYNTRIIPLNHYFYSLSGRYLLVKDDEKFQKKFIEYIDKLVPIMDNSGTINENNLVNYLAFKRLTKASSHRKISRKFTIISIVDFLVNKVNISFILCIISKIM